MKKTLLLLLLTTIAYAQKEKLSIGLNIIPLALNRTFDLPVEYRFDSTKSITVNLGATFNNPQDYAFCIQCADRPKIESLDAYSIKTNFRKYYKNKRKSQRFFGIGNTFSYFDKNYTNGLYSPKDEKVINQTYRRQAFIFSPNVQLGRSLFLDKNIKLDFGTQLNFPLRYTDFTEPSHYTPTRGMGVINFFFVLKFKLV
jgi:Protein of unknown function (DUF3575)